jgi:hypothetical protein
MSMLRWKQKLLPMGNPQGGGKGGGGGGSQPAPVQQTVNNTSIPDYARPYVETMLGTAQQQIFNYDDSGNVTGMKPYVPYSNNASDYIAEFSPLQQQAQSNVANMQVPGEYKTAMNYAQTAGLGALGTANPAAQYGGMGANFGTSAANLAPQAQQYGQNAADIGTTGGLGYGAQGSQAGQQGAGYGALGAQQGLSYGQGATNANAVQAYMNPYLQATLNPSMQLQAQQFGQLNAQNQGQATQQGAFGGGRQAIMQGLNQQNQMLAQNQLVGNAYNQAYNTANQNMQAASQLGMQGAGLGIQGQQAAMQGAGLGLQGVDAAMRGQQTGLQGLQQAGNLYGQGMQGAQIGLQGVGAQQAAYGMLGNQAANLGNLAGQQTQTALGINQAQQAAGAAQQAQQQNIINQAVQNYGTQQQYPMTQLANMSALLRGMPMQQTTTQSYQAAPSAISTLGGLGATALGAYGAAGGFRSAKGGVIKEYAAGGQVAFDVGGSVEADLRDMDIEGLKQQAENSPSAMIRQQAKQILIEKMAEQQAMAQGVGAATGGMQMAGGGIVAFAEGDLVQPEETKFQKATREGIMGLKNLGFGQPSPEDVAQRAEIKAQRAELKDSRDMNLWRGLMMGGAKAMESTSPFANVGIGKGVGAGIEEYTKGEKDYADQLKALRSGELDLSKLSTAERDTLLRSGVSGAVSQLNAEEAAAARIAGDKLRAQSILEGRANRENDKWMSLYGTIYNTNIRAAQDKLTGRALTEEEKSNIAQQSMSQVDNLLKAGGKKGLNVPDKGGDDPLNLRK